MAAAPTPGILALDNSKAGMAAVDKAEVERVINEASRGSPFYANEQRKAALRQKRLDAALGRSRDFAAGTNGCDRHGVTRRAEAVAREIEDSRATGVFVHVDMDMFFAAVEELLRPELKTVPLGVGGEGMLSTSNYLARKFGVRAAMPGYIARKLCPDLVIVGSSFDQYKRYSEIVRDVCRAIDPEFHSGGMDELTLNLGSYLDKLAASAAGDGDGATEATVTAPSLVPDARTDGAAPMPPRLREAAKVAEKLRADICARTGGLTASCGVAATPTLAKMCSNFNKPDGQFVCAAQTGPEIMAFLAPMGVRAIPGIGRATEHLLAGLGLETIEQVYRDRARLCYVLPGEKSFRNLLAASMGVMHFWGFGTETVDDNKEATGGVEKGIGRKSLSIERTFGGVTSHAAFMQMAEKVFDGAFAGLEEEGLRARNVTLKLKRKTFAVHQTTTTLPRPSGERDVLWKAFEALAAAAVTTATRHGGRGGITGGVAQATYSDFRLMGCRFADLSEVSAPLQPTLQESFAAAAAAAAAPGDRKRARPNGGAGKREVTVVDSDDDADADVVVVGASFKPAVVSID